MFCGASAFAQSEIDPDHFDSPNTEPLSQPKATAGTQIGGMRYDGKFTPPYEVECHGRNLRRGKYAFSLLSDGKVSQATLSHKGSTIKIAGIIQTQAAKRRNEVVVENNGKWRTLSLIRVSGLDFVFDPHQSADPATDRKSAHAERLSLRLTDFRQLHTPDP